MLLHSKRLIGLPVKTRGGTGLGKVSGLELDTETGRLATLSVRTRGVVHGLLDQDLIVAWSQVLDMTEDYVIVEDASVREGARSIASLQAEPALGEAGFSAMDRTEA